MDIVSLVIRRERVNMMLPILSLYNVNIRWYFILNLDMFAAVLSTLSKASMQYLILSQDRRLFIEWKDAYEMERVDMICYNYVLIYIY